MVLRFRLLVDNCRLGIDVATRSGLATFLELLLDAFLHLHTIGFDLLFTSVTPLHAVADSLLLLRLFSFVGCFDFLVDLGHFDFDVHIVIKQRLEFDPSLT